MRRRASSRVSVTDMAAQFTMCLPMTRSILLILALALPVRAADVVALCDVAANPKAFDGQTLEITAFAAKDFESSTLFDPRCESSVWVENLPKQWTLERATLRGTFSAGPGFGHLGQWSLFRVTEIVSVDKHRACGLDRHLDAEEPDADCVKSTFIARAEMLDQQRAADEGARAWAYRDALRVASERAPGVQLRRTQRSRGRRAYEGGGLRIVVSKPYWLSFFASNPKRVAWVAIVTYDTNCTP